MKKGQKRLMFHFAIRGERWGRNFLVKAEETENNGFSASFAAISRGSREVFSPPPALPIHGE
jgi:hypothetical protein